jgi:ABC-type amino acid transport substrate-binding protein
MRKTVIIQLTLGRIVRVVLFCLVLVYPFADARAMDPGQRTAAPNVLRVGVNPNKPPLIFERNGVIVGAEADLALKLAGSMGKTLVNYLDFEWEELIPALLDGKIDIIMSGMTATTARTTRISFSADYLISGQIAMVPGKFKDNYPSADSIINCKARVGVEKGTTGDFLVRQKFINAQRIPFDSPSKAVLAMLSGEIDMLVHDAPIIWWMASEKEAEGLASVPFLLTREKIAWGIRHDDKVMLQAANNFLAAIKKDGRLRVLMKRWIPSLP